MTLCLFFILVAAAIGAKAEHRNSSPLCTPVSSPALSPDRARAAHDLFCGIDGESPSIDLVITDPAGRQLSRFWVQPQKQFGEACAAEGELRWLDNTRVQFLCNYSPELNAYLVVNTNTGKIENDYTGLYFELSPDAKLLARVGVLQRFASPVGQKYCLLFNRTTVYPPDCAFEGEGPVTGPFQRKHKRFSTDAYSNIHTFLPRSHGPPIAAAPL